MHEVFRFFTPHGDAYAYISSWLAAAAAASRYPAVPHIVDPLKPLGNLRSEFGVPADAVVVGRHGASSQFGPVQSAALEDSNVDLTKELVAMIVQQRAYQANASVITTSDTLLNELVQLVR